jgi:hypothetical protein
LTKNRSRFWFKNLRAGFHGSAEFEFNFARFSPHLCKTGWIVEGNSKSGGFAKLIVIVFKLEMSAFAASLILLFSGFTVRAEMVSLKVGCELESKFLKI